VKITAEIAARLGVWIGSEQSYHVAAEALLRADGGGQDREFKVDQLGDQDFGDLNDMIETIGPVGILHISGSLVPKARHWMRNYGVVGYNHIREAMASLAGNDQIKTILLNVDSPGGSVTGISDLSDFMLSVKKIKPIDTFTGSMMASGGYWLGSVGSRITADKLAVVGSIGVITLHVSVAKAMEDAGYTVTVLRAGKFKAIGNPYEGLTDEAKAKIEADLQTYYRAFTSTVATHLGVPEARVLKDMAEGQEFIGKAALDVGLVHAIGGFDGVVKSLLALHNPQRPTGVTQTGANMKKRVLTEQGAALVATGAMTAEAALADNKYSVDAEVEETAEETAGNDTVAGTESGADTIAGGGAETEGTGTGAQAAAAQAAAAGVTAAVNAAVAPLQAQVTTLTAQLVEAQVATKGAEAAALKAQGSLAGFRKIAEASVQRLQVGLGMPAADCEKLTDEVLLETYGNLQAMFGKRFPAGQQSQAPKTGEEDPKVTALPAGATGAVLRNPKQR